jgi:hypothetical protein
MNTFLIQPPTPHLGEERMEREREKNRKREGGREVVIKMPRETGRVGG